MRNGMMILSGLMTVMLLAGLYFYMQKEPLVLPQAPQESQGNDVEEQVRLQTINQENPGYSLQHDVVNITFDAGENWREVPIAIEQLFAGEYQGNEQELITGSYHLTERMAAFLYTENPTADVARIMLVYSEDGGDTWKESTVVEQSSPIRFREMNFIDDTFGYVILSSGRTMSQEYSAVYVTNDGGETWEATTDPPSTRMVAFGGFVDDVTGFISYGTIDPDEPDMYVTLDSGGHWQASTFHVPEKYDQIFVQAEVPVKEDNQLKVLVNQGPNGDYEGGNVKGEFVSEDDGVTWKFSKEVEPDVEN